MSAIFRRQEMYCLLCFPNFADSFRRTTTTERLHWLGKKNRNSLEQWQKNSDDIIYLFKNISKECTDTLPKHLLQKSAPLHICQKNKLIEIHDTDLWKNFASMPNAHPVNPLGKWWFFPTQFMRRNSAKSFAISTDGTREILSIQYIMIKMDTLINA